MAVTEIAMKGRTTGGAGCYLKERHSSQLLDQIVMYRRENVGLIFICKVEQGTNLILASA